MRQRLTGAICAAVILAIVVGLPIVLLAVGTPVPSQVPSLDQVWSTLTSPDDGSLALGAICVVGWVCWLVLTVSVVLEVIAQARGGVHAPRVRGLGMPQSMARGLVTGAMLLVASAPAVGAASAAPTQVTAAAAPATASAAVPVAAPAQTVQERQMDVDEPSTTTVTVEPGDSLWALAEEHLGDGRQYTQILELNRDVLGDNDRMLTPGTELKIPTPEADNTHPATATASTVTVQPGDTLSAIADSELGSGTKFPQIVKANPDRLTDPDHIEPGWVLDLPATGEEATSSTPGPEAAGPSSDQQDKPKVDHARDVSRQAAAASSRAVNAAPPAPSASPDTSPSASPSTSPSEAPSQQHEVSTVESGEASSAGWMVAGLVGAGAILGGGLYGARRVWRQRAMRGRRPGRTIVAPSPELNDLDRTITHVGATTAVTVEWMDQVLGRLGASMDGDLPKVVAVELSLENLTLYLEEPMPAPAPWQGSEDAKRWSLTRDVDLEDVGPLPGQEAPWPLLVTIGRRDGQPWWLLNVEDLSLVVRGDPDRAVALARYIAAEIAVNAWSKDARVHLMGVGSELEGLNPQRVVVHDDGDDHGAARVLLEAIECIDRAEDLGGDVATLRARQRGEDLWPARALVVAGGQDSEALAQLEQAVRAASGRSGTGLIQINPAAECSEALVLHVDEHARVRIPHAGLEIEGVGLTETEARACAQLATEYRRQDEAPIPAIEDPSEPWQDWSDTAGAIREEHTRPRETPAEDEFQTLLEGDDEEYLEAGATTVEDLATLSPQVEANVARKILDADPTLDEDLAAWWSSTCDLPRVSLLGPVAVRPVAGIPLKERVEYHTEVVSYLALREHGATNAELQEAFGIAEGTVRRSINTVRDWLGVNPRTGNKHVPDAGTGPKARLRGTKAYELVDVLVDADLFRRLRLRGQARGGHEGIADLLQALRLVQGVPFSQLRRGGWNWLLEGERVEEELASSIEAASHSATLACLRAGDVVNARLATSAALQGVPYSQVLRLDLARIAEVEGDQAKAETIVRDEICNASDGDGDGPLDVSDRTRQVLEGHQWGQPRRRAS
ncbi:LysM peptidoglycan-binding domain-containing protein [Janibacter hoylei]|uniref:LysM peptidoglycan-binding domain-containing protein n=1 Tax=Janibacter hoylei TaxID=364298 RepID=UPI002237A373|nr:LysM peptidoglycan-binding domain-containing protein [Janibacter hoylei]MCW4600255.1 LysM peptidoglycan-binding domain-containing protein [Janibacter hoylei]